MVHKLREIKRNKEKLRKLWTFMIKDVNINKFKLNYIIVKKLLKPLMAANISGH